MGTPTPPSLVDAFCRNGVEGQDYNTIPIPSQVGVSPELASFSTGFPPATRTPRNQGGIPPRGKDMNGILRMMSAHTAWIAAGGSYTFNADVVTYQGGYNIGAVIRSALDPTRYYLCQVPNNTLDPDVDATGWKAFTPFDTPLGTQAQNIDAGAQTVAVLESTGFLDLNPNAGDTTLTDVTGGSVGQIVIITNMDAANSLTIQAGAGIRMAGDVTLLQNGSISLRRRTGFQWVAMS